MNFQYKAAILLAGLISSAPAVQAATLALPTFDSPVQGDGNFTYYSSGNQTPAAGLDFTNPGANGGSGITGNLTPFSGTTPAPIGSQVAFLQTTGAVDLSFNYNGPASGLFNFSFDAAERYSDTNSEQVNVLLNGVLIDTISNLSNVMYNAFTTSSQQLVQGLNTLAFQGVNNNLTDTTALISSVTVSAVPEPASIALLAAGAFGFAANRRKKSA
jgi:hypothetical protein